MLKKATSLSTLFLVTGFVSAPHVAYPAPQNLQINDHKKIESDDRSSTLRGDASASENKRDVPGRARSDHQRRVNEDAITDLPDICNSQQKPKWCPL